MVRKLLDFIILFAFISEIFQLGNENNISWRFLRNFKTELRCYFNRIERFYKPVNKHILFVRTHVTKLIESFSKIN